MTEQKRRYRPSTGPSREKESRRKLVEALCALPEWQRQAYFLRRFDEASTAEIALILEREPAEIEPAIAQAIEATADYVGGLL